MTETEREWYVAARYAPSIRRLPDGRFLVRSRVSGKERTFPSLKEAKAQADKCLDNIRALDLTAALTQCVRCGEMELFGRGYDSGWTCVDCF